MRGEDVVGAAILREQIQRQTHHNSTGKTPAEPPVSELARGLKPDTESKQNRDLLVRIFGLVPDGGAVEVFSRGGGAVCVAAVTDQWTRVG